MLAYAIESQLDLATYTLVYMCESFISNLLCINFSQYDFELIGQGFMFLHTLSFCFLFTSSLLWINGLCCHNFNGSWKWSPTKRWHKSDVLISTLSFLNPSQKRAWIWDFFATQIFAFGNVLMHCAKSLF